MVLFTMRKTQIEGDAFHLRYAGSGSRSGIFRPRVQRRGSAGEVTMRSAFPRAIIAASLVLAAHSWASPRAQSKPDQPSAPRPNFNGTWVDTAGGGERSGAFRLGPEFTAIQDQKTLTLIGKTGLTGNTTSVFALDGSATLKGEPLPKATWEG